MKKLRLRREMHCPSYTKVSKSGPEPDSYYKMLPPPQKVFLMLEGFKCIINGCSHQEPNLLCFFRDPTGPGSWPAGLTAPPWFGDLSLSHTLASKAMWELEFFCSVCFSLGDLPAWLVCFRSTEREKLS